MNDHHDTTPAERAVGEQRRASDPAVSAFVSAHAGAGKTKLLIDRLLRLMLADAEPARILCLTFTKAAAAEMAIRLQLRLGQWVTLDDAELDAKLEELPAEPSPAMRAKARALFARVLDLPGGMRIGTIHAFCQSLLRRFPLEARISPHFQLVEPSDARADLEAAREHALPNADAGSLEILAGLVGADGFAALVAALEASRQRLAPALALSPDALEAAMRRAVGVHVADKEAVIATALSWADERPLQQQLQIAASHGTPAVRKKAAGMLLWLDLPTEQRLEHWAEWVDEFMLASGGPRGLSIFAAAKLDALNPGIREACAAEQRRIAVIADDLRAFELARVSTALLRVAAPILGKYAETKDLGAMLDYDDLVGRTATLLETGADWVLFKLDGGLDHVLLDEVQDTAPDQWTIADRLTGDFFSGLGARGDALRTMFAVGDRKQSIYSFQGADPLEFDRWRSVYEERVQAAGLPWRPTELDVSFRSTAPVMALVDAVFADVEAADGVCDPGALLHVVNRIGHAGRVELWPVAPRPDVEDLEPWIVPDRNETQNSAPETLVAELARWIAAETDGGTMLESAGRPLRPGDVLILVRRRGDFDRALVRALKGLGVPVAGLDRMVLTEQAAVQDLLSLCDALLLPTDDLTFAEMLVSPLGGLSDDSLMRLALGRSVPLRDVLRSRAHEDDVWARTEAFFSTLLGRVDFAAPHALLTEALGALGGRARLYARLGPQAAEPVDEFLTAALHYGTRHTPSLQGFVHWLRLSGAEVKREAEAAGGTVRIMTVHGAKGLEAPLVILPDTTSLPPDRSGLYWGRDPDTTIALPLWSANKELHCRVLDAAKADEKSARLREYHRLLYVALTRARDRVLVCGWQTHRDRQAELKAARQGSGSVGGEAAQDDGGTRDETSTQASTWYALIERGMRRLGADPVEFAAWPGMQLRHEVVQEPVEREPAPIARAAEELPRWAGSAPDWQAVALPPEPALPQKLAPSRPEGIELGPVPASRSPLAGRAEPARLGRGLFVHTLLQHLPDLPEADREAAALDFARRSAIAGAEAMARQALTILNDPGLTALFGAGSRAEQPISGVVGGRAITGQVDRLVVMSAAILIADYKTSLVPPASPETVPVFYLRQMAAYRDVLQLLYPDRPVRCLLIWTEGPVVMALPNALLDEFAPKSGGRFNMRDGEGSPDAQQEAG